MGPRSIEGICDVELVTGPGEQQTAPAELLIEVPHGATRSRHFEATRRRLLGEFPEDLKEFFHVNTDVGSIEVARLVARMCARPAEFRELADPSSKSASVLIVRGLIPRTFVDCNRVLEEGPSGEVKGGITPGLPGYLGRPEDVRTLRQMHERYQAVAEEAFAQACESGGRALILHTYAPRSVEIGRVDEGIVAALRRAYEPEAYEQWTRRPDVDVISEDAEGQQLAPRVLVERLRERYAEAGVAVAENRTYRLFPGTMGYVYSNRYPGQVTCIEINRALLVEEFRPFEEMRVDATKARRMAAPIASALLSG